jgi:mRNA-degrading endonuclease RelE of RelBE toxin-antitoxin system
MGTNINIYFGYLLLMKIIITENQLKTLIKSDLEEEYPESWNIEDFKKIKSFAGRVKYCEEKLQRISSGSSRIVYKIDDEKVLKLAKNQKGIAQNETEIGFSNDYMWDGLIAEIFEYEENGLWVEMELARKLSPKQFQSIVGISFDDYCSGLRYYEHTLKPSKYFSRSKPEKYDEMWENEFTNEILQLIGTYDLPVGDMCRTNTYGIVKRDGGDTIVFIDYGLTNEVYDSYYR